MEAPPDPPISSSRSAFRGGIWPGSDKIVVGIDVGTTQSGVAFVFLERGIGVERTFHRVTHWPGQGAQDLQSKIPSLVWYDSDKKAVLFGAEAATPDAEQDAEDNGWQLAKHFKLGLHPDEMKVKYGLELCELPTGVSLLQIYTDFLGYLLRHTQRYFEERVVQGVNIWSKHRSSMQFVLAHPNGWGIREQSFLRKAAINAGLVTDTMAHASIHFVTEAEASVHYCLHHSTAENWLRTGTRFAVCDAGGSTVDTTVYAVDTVHPLLKIKEARASACVQAGAIFVDAEVEKYVHTALTNAGHHEDDVTEYTKRGVQDFEKNVKRNFRNATEKKTIDIAHSRVKIPTARVSRGRMELPGNLVKTFFDICVDKIKASVDEQIDGLPVSHMFLVGGFGDSPYLRQELKNQYAGRGCEITLANQPSTKAVADGAVIWSVVNTVKGRAPRFSFGVDVLERYDRTKASHRGRKVIPDDDGYDKVGGLWDQVVTKGVVLDAEAVVRRPFHDCHSTPRPNLECFDTTLVSYSGDGSPEWMVDKEDKLLPGFQNSCVLSANLQALSGALRSHTGARGKMYWYVQYNICIRFGGTELEAYLEWEEKGVTRTGPVTIIPDQAIL